MREYFEKKSKVEAFKSEFTFRLGDILVEMGDWVVIKDGVAKVMTSEDFEKNYTDKTITHTNINVNYPSLPTPYRQEKWLQPYYGDSPDWIRSFGMGGNLC
jgi:hypothetical protein